MEFPISMSIVINLSRSSQHFSTRSVCPESFEIYDGNPDPDPCSSHNDCIDNDQLCCRLYADRNDTYCREPEYVVD
ncbi:hypothetical protein Avbf_13892, partial [Armadillidium vulgare]